MSSTHPKSAVHVAYEGRLDGRRIALWGGSGGSFVMSDLDARMTVAYVMNRHVEHASTDQRSINITCAAYDSLTDGQKRG